MSQYAFPSKKTQLLQTYVIRYEYCARLVMITVYRSCTCVNEANLKPKVKFWGVV